MQHYTIVILDSHAGASFVTRRGLEWGLGAAAKTVLASSPSAAWDLCSTAGVDLLVLDPTDYGEAGWTLIRLLREARPELPVVVLASDCTPPVRRRTRALGVVCLPKTHDMSEICGTVSSLLGIVPHTPAIAESALTAMSSPRP